MADQDVVRSLALSLPELVLSASLLLVVLLDAFRPVAPASRRVHDALVHGLGCLALVVAMALAARPVGSGEIWSGMLAADPLAGFLKVIVAGAALLVVAAFQSRRELGDLPRAELLALVLALTIGNMLLAGANDLLMIWLALETVSLSSYVLVAYLKGDRRSNEASLKYLLFGAVASGTMLYGISLLYGLVGSTHLPALRAAAGSLPAQNQLALSVATVLVLAGFAFKTASVPFHFWCPDAYEGAPTAVAAVLSVAPKAAGFAVMLRFFFHGLATPGSGPWDLTSALPWPAVLMLVSVATMTVGNIAALTQTNMKRLLAYSSIAHAGFLMMGVVALSEEGARGMLLYLLVYVFMNIGAFLVVGVVHDQDGSFELADYAGLWRRAPGLALAMGLFLLSLMGLPPLLGFMGKLYVFAAVIHRGPSYYAYATIAALNAAIAAYYYARVLRTMVMDEEKTERPAFALSLADGFALGVLAAANVLPMFIWEAVDGWARSATQVALR